MTHVLYNPKSNCGRGAAVLDDVRRELIGEYDTADITGIDSRAYITSLPEGDEVVLCGGDGTLNWLATDLYGADWKAKLYLWKSGTGNDFLRDVAPDATGKFPIDEYLKSVPQVEVNGEKSRFVNGCGFGIDGMVCEVADDMIAKGKTDLNYAGIAIRLVLTKFRCPSAKVTVDGVTKTYKKVWLASAMNGRYYGGGMMLAPKQDRKSGKLSCVVWHDVGRLKALMRFSGIFKGEHVKYTEMIDVVEGDVIEVEFSIPTALQIDGETRRGVSKYIAKSDKASKEA